MKEAGGGPARCSVAASRPSSVSRRPGAGWVSSRVWPGWRRSSSSVKPPSRLSRSSTAAPVGRQKASASPSAASWASSRWPRGFSLRTTGRPSRTAAQVKATTPPSSASRFFRLQAAVAAASLSSISAALLPRSADGHQPRQYSARRLQWNLQEIAASIRARAYLPERMFPQLRERFGSALDLVVEFSTLGEYRLGADGAVWPASALAPAPERAPQLGGAGDHPLAAQAAVRRIVAGGAAGKVPVATPAARRLADAAPAAARRASDASGPPARRPAPARAASACQGKR